MKMSLTLITVLLLSISSFAQNNHKFVKLSEEKNGKRLKLYATNTDSISYDVFLRVVTDDFRRSSNRPTIKNVPANSKTHLITLIQLADSNGKYEATFIVNEVAKTLEVNKNHSNLGLKLDDAIAEQSVILFTSNTCSICPETKRILGDNNIGFTEYNIDEDSSKYLKSVEAFETDKTRIQTQLPLLKINDQFFKNINSIEDFNTILREAF